MELNDILVVYFSHTGATKNMAEEIAKQLDCDISEIVPLFPYPSRPDDVAVLEAQAQKEYEENARPLMKNPIDVSHYKTVFIGYPLWWYGMPMILYTFLDSVDLSGKNVIPFNTHRGTTDMGTFAKFHELCPNSNVLTGMHMQNAEAIVGNSKRIAAWLDGLDIYET